MSRDNENEMEQIQRNLEQFLQQEIDSPLTKQRSVREKYLEEDQELEEDPEIDDEDDEVDYDDEDDEDDDEDWEKEDWGRGRRQTSRRAHPGNKHFLFAGGKKKKRKKSHKMTDSRKNVKSSKRDKRGRKNGQPEKKSGLKKFLLVIVILFLVFFGLWYFAVGSAFDKMGHEADSNLSKEALKSDGVTNILLIGSDSRSEGDEGRSDAMILLSISNKTNTIHMTSLLRDMYVEIPGHDGNRLNAAYAYGGPELLLETVKLNLGIEVNRYVEVNFEAFANLVDAVGGVDMELTNEEVQWVNAYLNEYNLLRKMPIETDYLDASLSGVIHLNGPQALAYSRNRYIGTDFGRTERQRKVLSEVFTKLPQAVVTNSSGLINGLFPNLTTNLSKMECLNLSMNAAKLLSHDIIQNSIPLEGTYQNADIRGMTVLQVDFEANKEYIRTEIYGQK